MLVLWKATQVLGAKGAVLRILNRETEGLEVFTSYGLGEKYLSRGPVSSQTLQGARFTIEIPIDQESKG